jgi:hypothetical protein
MDNPNDTTYRVKALVDQVLQLRHSLGPAMITKLKTYVVDEMDNLVHDSLQC